jgi:hypothetical protein
MTKFAGAFASAALALAIGFGAGAAHAQCGNILDQPEEVYDAFLDFIGFGVFPIDDVSVCEKYVKTLVSACNKAVSDTASCRISVASSMGKSAKPICSVFKNEAGCLDDAKATAEAMRAGAEADAAVSHAVCNEELSEAALDDCLEGFPM